MNELVVDFAGLRSLAGGINKIIDETQVLLSDLGQRIHNLTELWEGAASDGFRRTQGDWFAAAEDLRTRLEGLRDLVVTAHDNHAAAVRTNTAMWRV
jgi:WXG100 family type VII secretion target